MDHATGVRIRQRIGHFIQPPPHIGHRKRPSLLQLRSEIVALNAGHHEEHEIAHLVHGINRDDVGMTQLGRSLRLPQKPRPDVATERQLRRQHLDRHEPLETLIARPIHDPHATPTNLLIEFICSTECLPDMGTQFNIVGGWDYGIRHSCGIRDNTWMF